MKKRIPGTQISYRGQMANWNYKGITSRECKRDVTKPIYEGMTKAKA